MSGANEQERRGASVLLAVLQSVREFGRTLTQRIGAPAGSIETFIEVPFVLGSAKYRPDGLIRVRRGTRSWTALVEVKTGRNLLDAAQVEAYLEIAREHSFDAVLTVSNEIATGPNEHPVAVDRRKTRRVALHHLSWSEVHTEALIERGNRSVSDPDQAWILGEFIRYLEYPKSGAIDFDDMGPSWVTVRDAAINCTLRPNDKAAADVVARFAQLTGYAAMRLSRHLGVDVRPTIARGDRADPSGRWPRLVGELAATGRMTGSLTVPHAVAPLAIVADLRAGRVACSVTLDAPGTGRPLTRVNWLVRQLREAPGDLLVSAVASHSRNGGPSVRLDKVVEQPALVLPAPKVEIRAFTLTLTRPAGAKRGQGRSSFVGSVLDVTDAFYASVVQHLKPWTAAAPRVKSAGPGEELEDSTGGEPGADLDADEQAVGPGPASSGSWTSPQPNLALPALMAAPSTP